MCDFLSQLNQLLSSEEASEKNAPKTDLRVSIIPSAQLTFPDGSTGTLILVSCSVKDIAAVNDEMSRSNSSEVSITVDKTCVNLSSTVSFRNMLYGAPIGTLLYNIIIYFKLTIYAKLLVLWSVLQHELYVELKSYGQLYMYGYRGNFLVCPKLVRLGSVST